MTDALLSLLCLGHIMLFVGLGAIACRIDLLRDEMRERAAGVHAWLKRALDLGGEGWRAPEEEWEGDE